METDTEKGSILEVRQRHLDATLARDLETLAATFADDGVDMPPGAPAVVGRDAYRTYCTSMLERMGDFSWAFDIAELVVTGDWAFERGTYSIIMGDGSEDRGKYLWLYQRDADGHWRFARTIYNPGA